MSRPCIGALGLATCAAMLTAVLARGGSSAAVDLVHPALDYPAYCGGTQEPIPAPSPDEGSSLTLVQAQVFIRHGDRTPAFDTPCWANDDVLYNCTVDQLQAAWADPSTTSVSPDRLFVKSRMPGRQYLPGNCGLGQLTERGVAQQRANGKNLRDAYVTREGLLPENYWEDPDAMFFRSDDAERTIESGQSLVDGLYPPESRARAADAGGIPIIRWWTMDEEMDDMVVPPTGGTKVCPALGNASKAATSSPAFQDHLKTVTAPLDAQCEKVFGVDVPDGWVNGGINSKLDCLMTHVCYDRPVPSGLTQELFDAIITEVEWQNKYNLDFPNVTRFQIGKLVGEVYDKVDAMIRGSAEAKKFWLYSGHDNGPIMPLLSALGAFDGSWAPYAALIALEVYQVSPNIESRESSDDYVVRLVYNGKELTMESCGTPLCPISTFASLVSKVVPSDAECGLASR